MGIEEDELYIYTLNPVIPPNGKISEIQGARLGQDELKDEFGTKSRDYIIAQIGRAKAWANLIAQDWLRALALKREQHEGRIFEYETQEFCHQGAVNNIIRWQNRLEAFDRAAKRKAAAKRGKTEAI